MIDVFVLRARYFPDAAPCLLTLVFSFSSPPGDEQSSEEEESDGSEDDADDASHASATGGAVGLQGSVESSALSGSYESGTYAATGASAAASASQAGVGGEDIEEEEEEDDDDDDASSDSGAEGRLWLLPDEDEAFRWFSASAAAPHHDGRGQGCLGSCYWAGIGCKKDSALAIAWWRKGSRLVRSEAGGWEALRTAATRSYLWLTKSHF